MSEIFLSFAGRDEAAVRQKAKELVTLARTGVDFVKLVAENSDRPDAAQTKGKIDPINVKELDAKFANAIKGLKVGGIADPVEIDSTGISILKIDERTQPSNDAKFDENAVRMAILNEKAPQAQKDYLAKLRDDAYIKISDTYRPMVSPILFADERKDKSKEKPANK
jgi:parvulin-like peptidyl-prolyl isomerase